MAISIACPPHIPPFLFFLIPVHILSSYSSVPLSLCNTLFSFPFLRRPLLPTCSLTKDLASMVIQTIANILRANIINEKNIRYLSFPPVFTMVATRKMSTDHRWPVGSHFVSLNNSHCTDRRYIPERWSHPRLLKRWKRIQITHLFPTANFNLQLYGKVHVSVSTQTILTSFPSWKKTN